MAIAEAIDGIAETQQSLGSVRRSRKRRKALREIERELEAILDAAELLAEAHRRHLLCGD